MAGSLKKRSLVLVVDPERGRRRELAALLEKHTLVVAVAGTEDALETTLLREPFVVCVAMRVGSATGLEVAKALRGLPQMEDAAFVVYGADNSGRTWGLKAQKEAKKKFAVDHLLVGEVELRDVVAVAWSELKSRRQAEAEALASRVKQLEGGESRSTIIPPEAERSLEEVVQGDSAFDSLKVLLTTDVVAPSHDRVESEQLDAMSWSELLRSRATLNNLRMALQKFLRSGSPDKGT